MKGNKTIRNSGLLKAICYILIPVFIIMCVCCIVYSAYLCENLEYTEKSSYYETESFANQYIKQIHEVISNQRNKQEYKEITNNNTNIYSGNNYNYKITDNNINIYYKNNYNYRITQGIKYLIRDKQTNNIYTNIPYEKNTDSIEELNRIVEQNKNMYWNYNSITKQIDTNINNVVLLDVNNTYLEESLKNRDLEIYSFIDKEMNIYNNLYFEVLGFNMINELKTIPVYFIPILVILTLAMGAYLLCAIGYKKGVEEINLSKIDKLPIEISVLLALVVITVSCAMISECYFQAGDIFNNIIMITIVFISGIISYTAVALFGTSFIKKIKSKTLIKSSLCYIIITKSIKIAKKIFHTIFDNIDVNFRAGALFVGVIILSLIILLIFGPAFGVVIVLVFWSYILYKILDYINKFRKIKKTVKEIYNGRVDIKINEAELKGELKELSIYINDIASGFSNAIEKSLKSERLKTELITNVSHDIKTPLTSIINYVDLLKKEEIEGEKAKEYIEVLDNKSQRLKKLIEDLVEASKVTSGNVQLNIENINIIELIKQTTGEFEDKFKSKKLEILVNFPKEQDVFIQADNRYMYRIIENVFSNINKYALENSRVYIDVALNKDTVNVSIKNISKDQLNMSVEELMQRFVRGDKSRTTEGSGLGISIAKSLTELQNGRFNIFIDGDLFKVEIEFKC